MKKVTVFFLFILVLAFSISKIYSYDIWYHLAAGRYILESGSIPRLNVFSYTQAGHEWVDIQWLFQVIAYGVYSVAGADGLILLKSLCLLLAFAILFRTGYRGERAIATAVFFYLAVLCSHERFFARPEIFSIPLFALYLKILLDDERRRSKLIYLLPVLQLLWVNVQGLFVLGIILVFFHFVSRAIRGDVRRPALLLLLCIAACFVNPYACRGALFPLLLFKRVAHLSNVFASTIAEFISPLPTHNPLRLLKIFLSLKSYTLSAFICLAILSLFTFVLNLRRTNLFLLLSYIAFLYLAASAKRNLPIFAFAAAAAAVHNINSFLDGSPRGKRLSPALSGSPLLKTGYAILSIMAAATIFLVVTDNYAIHEKSTRSFGFGVNSPTYPVGAVDFVTENGIGGNVFNTLGAGGYFIWKCYPERREFIDGRLEAISDEFYSFYISLLRDPGRWPECVAGYGVTYAILDHWVTPDAALFSRIYRDKDWALVHLDGSSTVFLLRNEENEPVIRKHEIDLAKLDSVPPPAEVEATRLSGLTGRCVRKRKFPFLDFTLGNLYSAAGMNDRAIEYYEAAAGKAPDEAAFYNNIGICHVEEGRTEEAIAAFERAIAVEPSHLHAVKNLAGALSSTGDDRSALRCWTTAHGLDPSDAAVERSMRETRKRLLVMSDSAAGPLLLLRTGRQLEERGNLDGAIAKYREAAAILPDEPMARYQLGIAYSRKGDLESARRQFMEAVRLNPDDGRAHHNLAALCQKMGMNDEAVEHYLSALAIDPQSVPSNFNLALLYHETGKKRKAKKQLKKVLKIDPGFEDAKKLLEKLK